MAYKQTLISLLALLILSLFLISCDINHQERVQPIICFTFDDAHLNAYENGFPLLEKYNFQATSFINSGTVGRYKRLSWEQILDLHNHNWEIGGHTVNHPELPELSDEDAYYQIVQDYYNFLEHGIELNSFALPSGHATERDYAIIKSRYKNIRNSIDKEMRLPLNRFDLGYYAYQTEYTPQMVKERIIRGSINGEALIVIGFHQISENNIDAIDYCRTEDFEEILCWLAEKEYIVMRLDQAVEKILTQ